MRPDALIELRLARPHPVIVLVSTVDRRIVPALRLVARLPFAQGLALHISFDAEQSRSLAADWMRLGLSWLPLEIRDHDGRDVASAACHAVREIAEGEPVTVVVPELDLPQWWHPLLHRRRARHVAALLQSLPGVTAVIVPVCRP